jgi:hypothetical protein
MHAASAQMAAIFVTIVPLVASVVLVFTLLLPAHVEYALVAVRIVTLLDSVVAVCLRIF